MTDKNPSSPDDSSELTISHNHDSTEEPTNIQAIGPYKILKELGRGGQGIVFLAEDTRLGRKVALKVLTSWSQASPNVIARFEREAAIASKLDHPGICTVYETGESNGAPFMVMRFVEGMSLSTKISTVASSNTDESTMFLDLENISEQEIEESQGEDKVEIDASTGAHATHRAIESVVDIIEKAARALHVAHEAGVIHRDIKPGNIMITKDDEPVILDFGLARDTDSDHQTLTQTGDLFGTPAYMAPEQLKAQETQIDRRVDIWALGVTLYEGLGLQRPFVAPTRDGLYQQILHQDPFNLRKLNVAVPKDLHVIVETALEKNRDRRYQTAMDLAEDLRRFRELKPIHAKPVGQLTRLLRWYQRNRAIAAALILILVSLSGGLVFAIQERSKAQQALRDLEKEQIATKAALDETEAERIKTAEALKHAKAVKQFLNDDVLGQVSPEEGNKDVLVRDLLAKASKSIEGRFDNSPLIEADIQSTMGGVYLDLGEFAVAQSHFSRALELRRRHAGENHPNTLTSMNNLALLHEKQGEFELALPLFVETLRAQRSQLGDEHPNTLTSMNNLAVLLEKQGMYGRALPLFEQSLATRRRVLGEQAPATLNSMNNLALLHEKQGRLDLAQELYEQALDTQTQVLGESHPNTLISMGNLAKLYKAKGEFKLALDLYEKTLAARRRVLGEEHPTTLSTMNNLAVLYHSQGQRDLALPLYKKTLATQRRILGDEHPDTLSSMNNLAMLYKVMKKLELARPLFEETLIARKRKIGDAHPDTLSSMNNLASLYYAMDDFKLALPLYEKALHGRGITLGENHPHTLTSMTNLGSCLVKIKSFAKAETILLKASTHTIKTLGERHASSTGITQWLVHLYKLWGKPDEAAKWKEKLPRE